MITSENKVLHAEFNGEGNEHCSLTSPEMLTVQRLMEKVAVTDSTVLITGASGTGKSDMAKTIHEKSLRSSGPFITVNCGAIPENLLESEFFGHSKGAFTGADKAKRGLFQEADRGTIFLDEIGDLPLPLQVKLLHVLEEQQIRPLGSETARRINVRVIAATNHDLEAMVKEKTFREDLYYRLNVFNLVIPALNTRRDDIVNLSKHFCRTLPKKLGLLNDYSISPEAIHCLRAYRFPGNVRELQNILSRALVLAEDYCVQALDLPAPVSQAAQGSLVVTGMNTQCQSLRDQVKQFERDTVMQTIEEANGDRRAAAKRLNIALSSLYRKLGEAEESSP